MILDAQSIAERFFSNQNASSYDLIVKYTTFGRDSVWKQNIAKYITPAHKCILDIACGTGIFSSFISDIPYDTLVGADLTYSYIYNAKTKRRYSLLVNSITEFLPFKSESFDCIVSCYLAKYAKISLMVDEVWRILKKDGIVIFSDFVYPLNKIMRFLWNAYFHMLKLTGQIIKSWQYVFSNLDAIIKNSKWIQDLKMALEKKGFQSLDIKYYTGGTVAIMSAFKI
ncbi:MAG TPA: class I SAM-dependent methyltransferase [Nitrososphaeraceae archaeon]|nr:class I SAM-dependent methyltransferase [Nitrososphaeraceae archaeon]